MKAPTITVCLLFTFLLIPYQYLKAQGDDFESDPILMLKEFYTAYIIECSKGTNANLASIREKYCTKDLLKRIYGKDSEMLDYDPFLNSQDCDLDYLKTLTISRESIEENIYVVTYVWPYHKQKISIRLEIMKARNAYKISNLFF